MKISKKQRLILTICISFSFFAAELSVGFYTHSIALIADAFHYLSDVIGIVVALVALVLQDRAKPAPQQSTYGWQRATILGAFFNGVFLLALAISILVQAVERFVSITRDVGSAGLALNILVLSFLHEHDHGHDHHGHGQHNHCDGQQHHDTDLTTHDTNSVCEAPLTSATGSHHEHRHVSVVIKSPGRDLGTLGVFIHVLGDAINNIGVIIAAVIIWKVEGNGRYYADSAVGVLISLMILGSAIPLVKNSGAILLQTAPRGINLDDIKHDIEKVMADVTRRITGIESVHELHIWRLDQRKSIASAHIVVDDRTLEGFADKAKIIMECLHAYGVHSATLQPELVASSPVTISDSGPESPATLIDANHNVPTSQRPRRGEQDCQLTCGTVSTSPAISF
ncbi:zinc/cadmium resistance protein [Fusarium sporotrichioides]|uniref:Zinc/cadmium resistance protein n=1 Tax=Fusarium sporotrichioides TaxID=5514 RepID=A0A395RII9_FUSSP|nr:zinc/cadmium resistance protein [Fusarium sporotrichioides]